MKKHFKCRIAAGMMAIFMTGAASMPSSLFKDATVNASAVTYQKGDVDLNGRITWQDKELLAYNLLPHSQLNANQLAAADMDNNGTVDLVDLVKLIQKLSGRYDVNGDGSIDPQDYALLHFYLVKQITLPSSSLSALDNNFDGRVTSGDLEDLRYRLLHVSYVESDLIRMGDLNKDGKVNSTDVNLLNKYLSRQISLTTAQLQLSDLNNDGRISTADTAKLRGLAQYSIGDANCDGKVNQTDKQSILNHISGISTLSNAVLWFADYNGDGVVDISDAFKLGRDYNLS